MIDSQTATAVPTPLAGAPCFIERQFPVAKLSAESYAERRANQGQSITGLGKWWGRKPLVLVRAAILGLLLPATDDPKRDGEIFLKLMTMDEDGLLRRKSQTIPPARLLAELEHMTPSVQRRFIEADGTVRRFGRAEANEREALQRLVFERMAYSEKLAYSDRPEQIDGPSPEAWAEINAHLGTQAASLPELVEELGMLRFGHRPHVGDAFCGGGSIPFEAARIGCDAYGSDLNPVAALLTWAALNIIGGGPEVVAQVQEAQLHVYAAVDRQVTEWGTEHNSLGWRADAYLYCVEVVDPDTGWRVPLAPSWVITEKFNVIARLVPVLAEKRYEIEIIEGATATELAAAREGTVRSSHVVHAYNTYPVPIERIRAGMRLWENEDVTPRPGDVFQERLYCIRWVETYEDSDGVARTRRNYRAPTRADVKREAQALTLLRERFQDWQARGYIPSRRIEPGYNTDQPIRERGWTFWHHLFTPRQLLTNGLLSEISAELSGSMTSEVANLLSVGRFADWNSRLCRFGTGANRDSIGQTFSNQALNTLYSFGNKALRLAEGNWKARLAAEQIAGLSEVQSCHGLEVVHTCDLWITDPPYENAVNYHEVGEFFIAWYERLLCDRFKDWGSDSRRSLAITEGLRAYEALSACYKRLLSLTSPQGMQLLMFTHQDASAWERLTNVIWAAGLRVNAAWTIQTERQASGLREGNYVQGTVMLVLRKRTETEPVFEDEIIPEIEAEVRRQLDFMTSLDDSSDPNFTDSDYQLAAYAAALRVLTARPIHEIDPARELARTRAPGEISPIERIIRNAVRIASDHLVPKGLDRETWKTLTPAERFYLKGLEIQSHGEARAGAYQEYARAYGTPNYDDLLANARANETRLKTASEFGSRQMEGAGFAGSLLRRVLFAVYQAARSEDARQGLNYLKTELTGGSASAFDYWTERRRILELLAFLARLRGVADSWERDAAAADLLWGAIKNDHV